MNHLLETELTAIYEELDYEILTLKIMKLYLKMTMIAKAYY
jgi:hypothetical protein